MSAATARKGVQPTPAALAPTVAAATVFVASGAVLVLEILAVRLLAPYVGLTLSTTTSIIGAALAGIAIGAAAGGLMADRREPRQLLVWLLIGGGLLALLTVPVVRALGPGARGKGDAAALGITLLALVPSAAVLSAISPTVARMQVRDLLTTGTIVGRLSAFATAGALLGTFGTGFVLVPLMPVSAAVLATGALLVVGGLALGLAGGSLRAPAAVAAAAAAVLLALFGATRESPCDTETTYHCASVIVAADNPNARELILDDLHHSYVDLKNPAHLEYGYTQWIGHAITAQAPSRDAPRDVVFVGGGGFTLPRWLLATHPGSNAHVLEVDGRLVDLDRERLGLRTSPQLQVTVGDARMTMRDRPTASADVVVGDAFGTYAVPWHLATREWIGEVKRVLKPGGLYALNVIDGGELKLMRAETATVMEQFRNVWMVNAPGADARPGQGNAVLLASDGPLPDRVAGSNAWNGTSFNRMALEHWVGDATPLRDELAPTDQLLQTS
ncbi:fused MFS/spermidine synthase [Conexibacter sp. JD483]|uniref:fused MFS/spermidine synthase n=1 Tax=unclassified Conexibacter TaxID=2627773 RepID=UPI00272101EF|nr:MULTISPECIES: fused MFS/spermidine synthase [unclassified Conexibacter]MDO8186628.1 fused MFS/spermidine synthase [Conexibacter sp. CPCC 205706]MDO8196733.1 fused MFS/spermidine synthase [Conexibacter sp. CPCC 205762]MDR9370900.1 fused MFS/spermidine synthase [Conexibacter sp. JD483]